MMATTHVFAGLGVAVPIALLAPEFAPVVATAAIVGGLFPDLDVVASHRKTLHYPVYYTMLAVPATLLAVIAPSATTAGFAVFVIAAALHSVADQFGGGLAVKPWHGESKRAVYSHYHGRWLPPQRWIGYDGSPGDLAIAALLALPLLFVFDGAIRALVIAMLVVSIGYTVFRKLVGDGTERLVSRLS
ncbi:metal-dependent hydrolase [Natrialbaceae archaeon A-arb3/5]